MNVQKVGIGGSWKQKKRQFPAALPFIFAQIHRAVCHFDTVGLQKLFLLFHAAPTKVGRQAALGIDYLIAGIKLRMGIFVQNIPHRPGQMLVPQIGRDLD